MNDVDTLLTTLHTANVAADTLFGGIEAFGKQGDYITSVLLPISLNVSFNSASDSIVHGLVLLLISINSSSFDTLFGGIEAFGKQGDYITSVLLPISLNVSFNSASDSIVHGLALLLISINSSSFN